MVIPLARVYVRLALMSGRGLAKMAGEKKCYIFFDKFFLTNSHPRRAAVEHAKSYYIQNRGSILNGGPKNGCNFKNKTTGFSAYQTRWH